MAGRDLRDLLPGPIVVGPMAGGPSRPELVLAATEGGALAFLAGGYRSADELTADLHAVRAATRAPYGVNIFVPGTPTTAAAEVRAYLASVEPEARALGAELGSPDWDDDGWEAKLAVLLADPPAVVSFTFGRPPRDVVAGLQAAGAAVVLTVTTAPEAAAGGGAGGRRPLRPGLAGGWSPRRLRRRRGRAARHHGAGARDRSAHRRSP